MDRYDLLAQYGGAPLPNGMTPQDMVDNINRLNANNGNITGTPAEAANQFYARQYMQTNQPHGSLQASASAIATPQSDPLLAALMNLLFGGGR